MPTAMGTPESASQPYSPETYDLVKSAPAGRPDPYYVEIDCPGDWIVRGVNDQEDDK